MADDVMYSPTEMRKVAAQIDDSVKRDMVYAERRVAVAGDQQGADKWGTGTQLAATEDFGRTYAARLTHLEVDIRMLMAEAREFSSAVRKAASNAEITEETVTETFTEAEVAQTDSGTFAGPTPARTPWNVHAGRSLG